MTFGPTVDPVLLPPQIEVMARAWLLGPMSPTPVMTRLPNPDAESDTVNGALRIEAGGGTKANRFQYDMQVLLHAYSPDEGQAALIANQAISLMSAARGQAIDGFYVVGVPSAGAPYRRTDPDVNLPRYQAAVVWRVAGQPWNP